MNTKFLSTLFLSLYDEASDAAEAARLAAEADAAKKKTFTQEQVNAFLADEKRKAKAQNEKLASELEAFKSKVNLSTDEKAELEARVESLRSEFMTKEEILKQDTAKAGKKYKEDLEAKTNEANTWKTRFTQQTINRSITDAAIKSEAFNPSQIVAQLAANSRLVEELGEDNKPTGEYVAKVKITDMDKDGKAITLDLTVAEAVKKMSEQDGFANLFKGKGTGGTGGQNRTTRTTPIEELATDAAAYRAARKSGKLPL